MPTDYNGWGGIEYRRGLIINTHDGYSGGDIAGFDTGFAPNVASKSANGVLTDNSAGSWFFPGADVTDKTLIWDFRAPVAVTTVKWLQSSNAQHGFHKWQRSDDGSSWTDEGSQFTLGGDLETTYTLSGTPARYLRLLGMSLSASSGPWQRETEFETDHGDYETGDRTAVLTCSLSGITLDGGTVNNLVDGQATNVDADSIRFTNGLTVDSSCIVEILFPTTVPLNAVGLMCLATDGDDNGVWKVMALVGGSWQDYGSSFTMDAIDTHVATDAVVAADGVRFVGVSGTTNATVRLNEVYFNTQGILPDPTVVHPSTVVTV